MPADAPAAASAAHARDTALAPRDAAGWGRLLSVPDLAAMIQEATESMAEVLAARKDHLSHLSQQKLEVEAARKDRLSHLSQQKLEVEQTLVRERAMRAEIAQLKTAVLQRDDETVKLNAENARLRAELHRLRGQTAAELEEAPRAALRAELEQALLRVEGAELRSEAEEAVARAMPDGVCPMTLSLMRQPVVLADGNSYEKSFADDWMLRELTRDDPRPPQSPLTNAPLAHLYVTKNHMLRKVIIEAVDQAVLELGRRKQAPGAASAGAGSKRRRE